MMRPITLTAPAALLLLAACSSSGGTVAPTTASPTASVATASPGQVANYVDDKSRCTAYWNFDTTANVQLKNAIQRIGITPDWTQDASEDPLYLTQSSKHWPEGGGSGLAAEGEWECKQIPWAISSDRSRVYAWDGVEWTGSGDNDFYWGHTQDVSGAAQEPNGWVKFTCTGTPTTGGKTAPCPEKGLETFVQPNWDAENDNWKTLEKSPRCEFSATSALGCWETGKAGGQYDGQFNFNATAWSAPMRVQLGATAKDDAGKLIVWEVSKAEAQDAIWPYLNKPTGALLAPGTTLYVGAYAMASAGYHGFTLTLTPKYTLDDSGTINRSVAPKLANKPVATVSVGITLSNVGTQSGPPRAEAKGTKDVCTVNPRSSGGRTYSCDVESAGTPFTYGGAWSATIKTQ